MKALVIGAGSIGRRHLGNLRRLGVERAAVLDPDADRRGEACEAYGVTGFDQLDAAFGWAPDLVVVASPTALHAHQALLAARRGCHLFVEKPLAHSPADVRELAEEVGRRGLTSLVGCNMRFHPGPAAVKRLLDDGAIGRPLFARVHTGSYLPDWRADRDYRTSYSASASQGGGCILDCIHEIDLARWFLGPVTDVVCAAGRLSDLAIDTEDVAALICRHADGQLSEIHLDYVQRTYHRGCHIAGERGTILWDFATGCVRYRPAGDGPWQVEPQPDSWELNQMYLDELMHLLDCMRTGRPTVLPVADAVDVLRIALAAKASATSGCFVATATVL